jgi:hypothetical protein
VNKQKPVAVIEFLYGSSLDGRDSWYIAASARDYPKRTGLRLMHVTAKAFTSGSDHQPVIDLSRTISVAIGVCPLCGILGRSGTRADQHLVDAFPVHVDNLNPEPVPFEGI